MMSVIIQQSQGLGPPGGSPVFWPASPRDSARSAAFRSRRSDAGDSQVLPDPHFMAAPCAKALILLALMRSARDRSSWDGKVITSAPDGQPVRRPTVARMQM
jgi:hypothetical protein